MMTIGNVLDYKRAVQTSGHTAGPDRGIAQGSDLQASLEYRAWEALEAGKIDESQDLVRQLLQFEREKAAAPAVSDAAHLLTVERHIRNVLLSTGNVTPLNKFKVSEAVTEFLWETLGSAP